MTAGAGELGLQAPVDELEGRLRGDRDPEARDEGT
jgi:hypothetical protein